MVAKDCSTCDARSWVATLTDIGMNRVLQVYPAVPAEVRSHLFDHRQPGEVAVVGPDLARIASRLGHPQDCPSTTLPVHRQVGGSG